jgi:arsenite-transporting ATPase
MEEYLREDNLLRVIFRETPVEKDDAELNVNKNMLDKLRSMRRLKI